MLCLHLFNRNHVGLYQPFCLFFGKPLAYYVGLLSDACVPMFCFVTGFGLYEKYKKNALMFSSIMKRLFKFYLHFLVVLVFTALLFICFTHVFKPFNWFELVLNATGISNSMNSTWWYVMTYACLCLITLPLFKMLRNTQAIVIISLFLCLYCIAFYFRVYQEDLLQYNVYFNWIYRQSFLLCTSLLPFVFGYLFSREHYFERLTMQLPLLKNGIARFIILLGLIILHALIPNFIIAPFTALILMVLIVNTTFSIRISEAFDFIQIHSTNLWLLHFLWIQYACFKYLPKLMYAPLIFISVFGLSITFSLLLSPIQRKIAT